MCNSSLWWWCDLYSVGANVFPWDFREESKPTIFLCSLGISYDKKMCQNSKWPPHERKKEIKTSIMVIETHAVDQFYVLSSHKNSILT